MAEWLKDHGVTIGHLNLTLGSWIMVKLETGRALRWKGKTVGWEGRGVVVESQHLQNCSTHLCQLRTDGLTPVSKC
jgi:hypothetical protein